MSLQERIDELTSPAHALQGLPVDRAMLGIALRLGTEGGKRFRPWLFSTVYSELSRKQEAMRDAAPRDTVDQAVLDSVAASLELLHSAFVIHDDVIDNDDTRRGRASVPGWFAASSQTASSTYARAGGILTGDLALAAAVRGMATSGAPAHVTTTLLDLLDAMLQDSAAGELADVRLADGGTVPSLEEALAVTELKTAAYSFVLPMQAAAVVAQADDTVVTQVGEVGRALGIAFQLRDDLCGMFAEAETTGKDPVSDLREGKRTPLVAHAAHTDEWWRIHPHLGNPEAGREELEEVRRALVDAGSAAYVEQLIERLVRWARLNARPLELEASVVDRLTSTWTMPATAPASAVEVVA